MSVTAAFPLKYTFQSASGSLGRINLKSKLREFWVASVQPQGLGCSVCWGKAMMYSLVEEGEIEDWGKEGGIEVKRGCVGWCVELEGSTIQTQHTTKFEQPKLSSDFTWDCICKDFQDLIWDSPADGNPINKVDFICIWNGTLAWKTKILMIMFSYGFLVFTYLFFFSWGFHCCGNTSSYLIHPTFNVLLFYAAPGNATFNNIALKGKN